MYNKIHNNDVINKISTVKKPRNKLGEVTGCQYLNVRSEPSLESEVITVLEAGTLLEVKDCGDKTFYKIIVISRGAKVIDGYCMKKYITVND